jgi:glycosyltransferase involved in cell wall biosynthesis
VPQPLTQPGKAPLVSVCLPVFNGEPFLQAAVASVLAQTLQDFELVVFDNASTDGTWARLQAFGDPRIRLHRNDSNLGAEANWNKALAGARGEYVKIFNHDDLLEPECLARQAAALAGSPEAALAFCGRTIILADGRPFLARIAPWPEGPVAPEVIVRDCVRAGTNLVGEPSAVMFRRECALKAGAFDGSIPYLIDLDYWVRLLEHGSGFCMRSRLASFRLSPHQWTAVIGRRQSRQYLDFMERLLATRRYRLSALTCLRGRLRARLNGLLRALVYRFVVRDSA